MLRNWKQADVLVQEELLRLLLDLSEINNEACGPFNAFFIFAEILLGFGPRCHQEIRIVELLLSREVQVS